MINYLLDTNLLLRLSDKASPDRALTEQVILKLRINGDLLCITTQNLIEFWAVVTRPPNVNGYGWTTQQAAAEVQYLLKKFLHLADSPQRAMSEDNERQRRWRLLLGGNEVVT